MTRFLDTEPAARRLGSAMLETLRAACFFSVVLVVAVTVTTTVVLVLTPAVSHPAIVAADHSDADPAGDSDLGSP